MKEEETEEASVVGRGVEIQGARRLQANSKEAGGSCTRTRRCGRSRLSLPSVDFTCHFFRGAGAGAGGVEGQGRRGKREK